MKINKKNLIISIITIILFMSLLLFFILPIKGWLIESPGKAQPLTNIVKVNGEREQYTGNLMLTTVRIRQATPYLCIKAHIGKSTQLKKQEEVMGNANDEQYNQLQQYYMETSANNAKAVALKLAHKPYHFQLQGIYVLDVDKQSPFYGKLKIGDLITKFNGHQFKSQQKALAYIQKQKVGQKMVLTVQRQGKTKQISGRLMKLKETKQAGIGISLVSKTKVISKEKINIDAGNIGGPSAGLMFTLQTYELLTNINLQQGKIIAGTGEVFPDGTVGRIGGVRDKVISAYKNQASVFLVPDDTITSEMKKADPHIKSNYQEALEVVKEKHYDMKVVPVKTVKQALQYLQ